MYLCRAITEDNLHVRTDRLCTHADAATKEEARRFVEQKLGEIEMLIIFAHRLPEKRIACCLCRILLSITSARVWPGSHSASTARSYAGGPIRSTKSKRRFSTTQCRISAFVSDQSIWSDDSFAVIFSPQIPTTLGNFLRENLHQVANTATCKRVATLSSTSWKKQKKTTP